jgi:hypothetical protein
MKKSATNLKVSLDSVRDASRTMLPNPVPQGLAGNQPDIRVLTVLELVVVKEDQVATPVCRGRWLDDRARVERLRCRILCDHASTESNPELRGVGISHVLLHHVDQRWDGVFEIDLHPVCSLQDYHLLGTSRQFSNSKECLSIYKLIGAIKLEKAKITLGQIYFQSNPV